MSSEVRDEIVCGIADLSVGRRGIFPPNLTSRRRRKERRERVEK